MPRDFSSSSSETSAKYLSVHRMQKSAHRKRDSLENTYLEVPELRGEADKALSEVIVTPYNQRLPSWRKANEQDRNLEKWSNRLEFIIASLGYTIGISAIFVLPIRAVQFGGVYFITVFLFMCAFIGVPLLFLEVAIGQFSGLGPVHVFGLIPFFKGLGYTVLLETTYTAISENMDIAHKAFYLFHSFRSTSPGPKVHHVSPEHLGIKLNYFKSKGLFSSKTGNGLGSLRWPLVGCLAFGCFVVSIVISRYIKTMGKILRYLIPTVLLLVLVMFIYVSIQLGGNSGLAYFMTPGNQKHSTETWLQALKLMISIMGFGNGVNTLYGSHTRYQSPAHFDCLVVSVVTCCVSLMSCLFMFAGLGVASNHYGIDLPLLHTLITDNTTLSSEIVIYPLMLELLPNPEVWYSIFCLLAYMLSITAMFALVSIISRSLYAFNPILRLYPNLTSVAIVVPIFLLGLPFVTQNGHILWHGMEHLRWVKMIIIILELVAFIFFYGLRQLQDDINFMLQYNPSKFYSISWTLTPFIVTGILIYDICTYEHVTELQWTVIPRVISYVIVILPIPLLAILAVKRYHRRADVLGAFRRRSDEEELGRETFNAPKWDVFSKHVVSKKSVHPTRSASSSTPCNTSLNVIPESFNSSDSNMDESVVDPYYTKEPELPHWSNQARMKRRARNNLCDEQTNCYF